MAKLMRKVPVRLGAGKSYEIEIGAGTLLRLGQTTRRALPPGARRLAVISNRKVFDLYGAAALESLLDNGFEVAHWLMGDGERFKSLRTLERAIEFLVSFRLERGDGVVALGGGVVGDLAGFAAATYLRGVSLIQVPTTLLAQIDSSIGGKTGVNIPAGKNLVGAFHQPRAVVIDTETLRTLPARELTAGWCEALKQGAVASRHLFEQTRRFLAAENVSPTPAAAASSSRRHAGVNRVGMRQAELAALIAAQCAFKARIVARDERESQTRSDKYSRRVLNFGHTIGHALEAVTAYRRFRHGEAVGYGMIVAGEISKRLGLLADSELELLKDGVRLAGRLPRADDLGSEEILNRALAADKKTVGGQVQWVLSEGIGRPLLFSGEKVPANVVRAALRSALSTAGLSDSRPTARNNR